MHNLYHSVQCDKLNLSGTSVLVVILFALRRFAQHIVLHQALNTCTWPDTSPGLKLNWLALGGRETATNECTIFNSCYY